jgi:hypothetical protein
MHGYVVLDVEVCSRTLGHGGDINPFARAIKQCSVIVELPSIIGAAENKGGAINATETCGASLA